MGSSVLVTLAVVISCWPAAAVVSGWTDNVVSYSTIVVVSNWAKVVVSCKAAGCDVS